ncbi:MAG: hypothetical protein LBD76_01845 [Prevotellaceae bacterium]|nr:hypothetical protein [Prevotellaceae bacterium]
MSKTVKKVEKVATPEAEEVATPEAEEVATPEAEKVAMPEAEEVATPEAEEVAEDKRSLQIFKDYPGAVEIYYTSDNTAFLTESDAKNYARTLEDKNLITVRRT